MKETSRVFYQTAMGQMVLGDCIDVMKSLEDGSVDLIMTSPPYALIGKKEYGNVHADEYLDWFKPFAQEFHRVLKDSGSLVIDIGGVWNEGLPTRHLYHFKLPIMLCEELGFHLAQEMYWWNPTKISAPTSWVNARRIRVKDAVNTVWWLSKTPWPKASNRRVLQPYCDDMIKYIKMGRKEGKSPSGHIKSKNFTKDNGGSIPPNLIAISNADSNSRYLEYCRENGIKIHPARYPADLPEYFIRMLTDPGDLIVDPFAGSCVTGEVAERTKRRWICCELVEEYLVAGKTRFLVEPHKTNPQKEEYYRIPRARMLWKESYNPKLPFD
jgi:site-specific DNA-methyltransferase (cytosine-N4-specific)